MSGKRGLVPSNFIEKVPGTLKLRIFTACGLVRAVHWLYRLIYKTNFLDV